MGASLAVSPCCSEERSKVILGTGDSARYERAVADGDITTLVELLESRQPIRIEVKHIWATHPVTVGSLAAMQLSVFFANSAKYPDSRETIRTLGAIQTLVGFLNDEAEDRAHAAVLAFTFIVAEGDAPHKANCVEIYRCGGLGALVKLLESPSEGARCATADICNMVCAANDTYIKEFVELGGLGKFVREIKGDEKNALVYMEYVEDVLVDSTGNPIRIHIAQAKRAGLAERVEPYTRGSEEAREQAAKLVALLSNA